MMGLRFLSNARFQRAFRNPYTTKNHSCMNSANQQYLKVIALCCFDNSRRNITSSQTTEAERKSAFPSNPTKAALLLNSIESAIMRIYYWFHENWAFEFLFEICWIRGSLCRVLRFWVYCWINYVADLLWNFQKCMLWERCMYGFHGNALMLTAKGIFTR